MLDFIWNQAQIWAWLFKAGLRELKVSVKFDFQISDTIWNWMEKINPKMLLNKEI